MKTIKFLFITAIVLFAVNAFAGNEKATINTSAQCEMCKERIEGAVSSMEGVKKVLLDVESAELKVKFDNEITSVERIKNLVAETGYTADDVKPAKEVVASLPKCCQPSKSCCASKKSASSCSGGK